MAEASIGKINLKSGEHRCVSAGGKKLSVCNIDGKLYCMDNDCTHEGGPLCEGDIDVKKGCVTCPWHGSVFDCKSGKAITGPATDPVKTYRINVKDGELFVQL
jgi:3-phenylpropionate/trans-cinnamate dioxygenase ferredoxin component